jgi:hypothetical protein
MPEDTWMKCEREMFLKKFSLKRTLTDLQLKFSKELLEKYNAHLVRSLFGDSPYVAQNLKESIIKSQGVDGGESHTTT